MSHAHGHGTRTAAEWIALLDDPARRAWQKPEAVVAALELGGDEQVVDVGAGSGVFARELAHALPRGRVLATDVNPGLVAHLGALAAREGLANLEARVTDEGAGVPVGTDLVLAANVLHHVPDPGAWLREVAGALGPGGRLAVVEFREMERPIGPPNDHILPVAQLDALAAAVGLTRAADRSDVLPWQHLLIYQKA